MSELTIPKPVTDADMVFGGKIKELLPAYKALPEEFRNDRSPWCAVVDRWFYKGLDSSTLITKGDINKTLALRHLQTIMGSFEPKHEHKISGVAYLMSLWFEPLGTA